jgi:hypothetical protein
MVTYPFRVAVAAHITPRLRVCDSRPTDSLRQSLAVSKEMTEQLSALQPGPARWALGTDTQTWIRYGWYNKARSTT